MDILAYFAHPFWIWLGIGAVFLVAELSTGSGWLLWPAGSAVIVALVSLIPGAVGIPWQIVLFVVATVITTLIGRRLMPRFDKSADINEQLGRLVGLEGKVAAPFKDGLGRVFVDGKEWAAELEDGAAPGAHDKVQVVEVIGGARLRVRPAAG
jgi:hypothetical protein